MHIILGILGAVVTILVLFKRLSDAGIDIGWLNPFAWKRRREWRKKYQGNPVFSMTEPMEVAALITASVAKLDGDMSHEEKNKILGMFESEFHLNQKEASDLLASTVFLFGDGEVVSKNIEKILSNCIHQFTDEQASSTLKLASQVCSLDSNARDKKEEFVERVKTVFANHFKPNSKW